MVQKTAQIRTMIYTWTLVVFVYADGYWRDWRTYDRLEECLEAAHIISYRRADVLDVRCERRQVPTAE